MPPDASAPSARPKFEEAIANRLSAEARQRFSKVKWHNRLTSLWAPVTVFGIAFAIYLFIVELSTPSAAWAQPALKGFGLLMIAWFVGLIIVRNVLREFGRLRKVRHQVWEFLGEISPLIDRYREKIKGPAYDDLLNHSVALTESSYSAGAAKLEEQFKATSAAADKHLATWRKQSAFDFGMGFVKAFAIAMIIRTVLIEPFRIPSGSMIPTLHIGDQIFVNKFLYGVRIPFTNYVPFVIVRKPERGDVIVFNNPVDESKDFIKRVVGLPGDKVELRDDVLYVNGAEQPRELLEPDAIYWDRLPNDEWYDNSVQIYGERLDAKTHLTAQRPLDNSRSSFGPIMVPAEHVFVLGDNRDNSSDSRFGFGVTDRVEFVPYGNIKGKAMVIWLSIGHAGFLSNVFGGTGLQLDRFFKPVR